jgi:hypothetical protein
MRKTYLELSSAVTGFNTDSLLDEAISFVIKTSQASSKSLLSQPTLQQHFTFASNT